MLETILQAITKGAKLYACISGGKDGQAMVKSLTDLKIPITGLVHCDLGRVEWPESLEQCNRSSAWHNVPLHIVTRNDKRDLLDHWKHRMRQLQFPGCDIATRKEIMISQAPFWSSSESRYCTSDMKRDPSDNFFRSCQGNFIISCEGIRAAESKDRAKKSPLSIRTRITSTYYKGMTVEEAIAAYRPDKRLALTWYPIFNYSTSDVWSTYGNTTEQLEQYRTEYKQTKTVNPNWNFHPAYVYGNERVSCMICVLGSCGDIQNGKDHNPALHAELVAMEQESGFTFKRNFSLTELN